MHGTDDGYFYLGSAHDGLGIDKEKFKLAKRVQELEKERASLSPPAAVGATSSRSWMLWGGAALTAAAIAFVVMKKRKGGAA